MGTVLSIQRTGAAVKYFGVAAAKYIMGTNLMHGEPLRE
jgi:hypothetical protein